MNEFQNQWVMRDTFEDLLGTTNRLRGLLSRVNRFLDHHEDCVSRQDGRYCDCAIETIREELAEELGDG